MAEKKPAETITARVLRDYWPTANQEDRVRKDTLVEVSTDDLIAGMESGTLERVKLP